MARRIRYERKDGSVEMLPSPTTRPVEGADYSRAEPENATVTFVRSDGSREELPVRAERRLIRDGDGALWEHVAELVVVDLGEENRPEISAGILQDLADHGVAHHAEMYLALSTKPLMREDGVLQIYPGALDTEKRMLLDRMNSAARAHNERRKRAAASARNPRPTRRHPRRDECLDIAREIMAENPTLKPHTVAARVLNRLPQEADDPGEANVPAQGTIAEWIRKEKL